MFVRFQLILILYLSHILSLFSNCFSLSFFHYFLSSVPNYNSRPKPFYLCSPPPTPTATPPPQFLSQQPIQQQKQPQCKIFGTRVSPQKINYQTDLYNSGIDLNKNPIHYIKKKNS